MLKELVNCWIKTLLGATAGNITVSVLLQEELSDYKKKYRQLRFELTCRATGFQRVNHIACRDPEIMLSLCDARQYQAVLQNSHSEGSISKNQILSMEILHIQENPYVLDNVALLVFLMLGYWFPKCGPGTSRGPLQSPGGPLRFPCWEIIYKDCVLCSFFCF